jgi:hypothetical protein
MWFAGTPSRFAPIKPRKAIVCDVELLHMSENPLHEFDLVSMIGILSYIRANDV